MSSCISKVSRLQEMREKEANTVVRTTDFGHDYQIIKAGFDYHVGGGQQSLK